MSRILLAAFLLCLVSCGGPANTTARSPVMTLEPQTVAIDPLDQPLPLYEPVKRGQLANGLTYFVLPHKKPEKRAQIWLVVNAGALQEDDDQRGLAHFVEHMSFNGTKRFPKQSLVDFIEKSGMHFGADLNAYTSFDETVYMLQVPTDRDDLVTKGFTVLRDWADGVTFDANEVEKERGVVLEEWRLGRGASMRLFDKMSPVIFHGSKYAERLPIGKPEIIQNAKRETLLRYYRDWYRPDLMAIVAVGDFDAADIETKIKTEFASLSGPQASRERPTPAMPSHDETLVSIETDPEATQTSVAIVNKIPHRSDASARAARRSLIETLYSTMLSTRLETLQRQADAPFLSAYTAPAQMLRPVDAFQQGATVKADGVERALSTLLEESERVRRHGFTPSEFERAKAQTLRRYEQNSKERDKQSARSLASEIVRYFLQGEAMTGAEAELRAVQAWLPALTLAEINQVAQAFARGSRVITVSGPASLKKPSAESLLALVAASATREVTPYDDAGVQIALMAQAPAAGSVVKSKHIPEIDVTEWTLSNGARVIVKPTKFRNDDVRMIAVSPGGHSLVADRDFPSGVYASTVIGQGGVGAFDFMTLRKTLMGKMAHVNTWIHELEEGLSASSTPSDLETMFQLTHLAFTAPRRDDDAFTSWRTRELESVKNRRLSPEHAFEEDMMKFWSQNHLRQSPTTPELLQQIDLDKAFAIYLDRFADASDFTFVLVGNLDLETLKPLVERYLASLPGKGRKERWVDTKVFPPKGVQTKTVQRGSEPKSQVALAFHGIEKWSRDGENDMRMLKEVLSMRLREVLREDMGGVYGVRVSGDLARRPHPQFYFSVRFGCAPDNVDRLTQAVFAEVKAIQEKGIGEDYIAKIKALRQRSFEVDLKENAFWLRQLESAYTYGEDPRGILDETAAIEKVSNERVKLAAKKYLSGKQYVLGVLRPDQVKTQP